MTSVVMTWQAASTFGWGILGLNVFCHWAVDPDITPLMVAPIAPGDLKWLDPLRLAAIRGAVATSNEFAAKVDQTQSSETLKMTCPVIDGLGNGFVPTRFVGTANLGRLIFEEAYAGMIARSRGGVYPELEIHTPTPEESNRSYNEYMADAFHRKQLGQLQPGEDVREEGGRVTVAGQTAVMAINALLCRVIFDANPHHEFYIEESFPLQWMYPYLTPYGIIMSSGIVGSVASKQPVADNVAGNGSGS